MVQAPQSSALKPNARTSSASPHPGVIYSYELVPGGSFSEDPAVDYDTAGIEVIDNVLQTLVSYNGSLAGPDPNDFVPNLATCVPGTAYCTDLYGNSLVSGGGSTFTFVINPSATFYVPRGDINSTGPKIPQTMSVWPNDVVFSFARTCLFMNVGPNPGWIQCQALLPGFNNTPTHILNAVVMNDTAAGCPSLANAPHGCVTFITTSSGTDWPEFLEFVADGYGGGIVSCRYATSIGAGLPGWSCGATSNPTGLANNLWTPYQQGLTTTGQDYASPSGPYAIGIAKMRWSLVGSGPYYLSSLVPATNYTLRTNPVWSGTGCFWTGCMPTTFAMNTVNTVWESNATAGQIALEKGQADLASVPTENYSGVVIPLLNNGSVTITYAPGLSTYFSNFDLNFSQSGAQGYLPNGTKLNAPSTLFQDLAFRQFLVHSYPYQTVQNQYNTVNGISTGLFYGGAIPKYVGNYYPMNVSWDMSDPGSGGGATPWWTNVTTEYGGIAKTACTVAKPCTFPFLSYQGAPLQDKINQLWISDIAKYSGGAVNVVERDLPFGTLVGNSFSSPGTNPMPMYELGWAPDYPDPTDYVVPMYMPDQSYTYGDAIAEGFGVSAYQAACPAGFEWKVQAATMACQGAAYNEMVKLMVKAGNDTNLPERVLLYNEVEHIAQQLGIFVPNPEQSTNVWVAASWLNDSSGSLNTNPIIGGNSENTWYTLGYAPSLPAINSFSASPDTITVGSWTNFTTRANGGTGLFTLSYAGLPTGCSSANLSILACKPSVVGASTVTVKATDQTGRSVTRTTTLNVTAALPVLVSVSVSPNPDTVPVGRNATFSATLSCSGGSCPSGAFYSWALTNALGTLNTQSGASINFTAGPTTGTDNLFVNASVNGVTKQGGPVPITIAPALSSVSVSPGSSNVPVGGNATFSAAVSCTGGGCPSGTVFSWTLTNTLGKLNAPNGKTVTFTAGPSAGTDHLFVNATLDGVTKGYGPVSITIVPTLSSVSISPLNGSVLEGSKSNFSASTLCNGGSCPSGTTYLWSLSNGTLGALNTTTGVSVAFTAYNNTGTVSIAVSATLGAKTVQSLPRLITILSSAPTLSSLAVSPASVNISTGQSKILTSIPTCFRGPCPAWIVYSWSLNSNQGILNGSSGPSVTFTAGYEAGNVTLHLMAVMNGSYANATVPIHVLAVPPALSSVGLSPPAITLDVGGSTTFIAVTSCTGGPCPAGISLSFSMSNGLGTLNYAGGRTVTFHAGPRAGTVTLTVTATMAGTTRTGQAAITIITTSPTPQTIWGVPPIAAYLLLALAGVAGAVVVYVFMGRRKPPERSLTNPGREAASAPVEPRPPKVPTQAPPTTPEWSE